MAEGPSKRSGSWISYAPIDDLRKEAMKATRFLVRREFQAEPSQHLEVLVSASSRYRLFINGHSVGTGPRKGDQFTQYYDRYDLSPWIAKDNVLAAEIVHYPYTAWDIHAGGPQSIVPYPLAAFWLEGVVVTEDGTVHRLDTDSQWLTARNDSVQPVAHPYGSSLGQSMEWVDGEKVIPGWQQPECMASFWQPASVVARAVSAWATLAVEQPRWDLRGHDVPRPFETERPLWILGAEVGSGWSKVRFERGQHTLILDAGQLTTGYVHYTIEAGRGSRLRFTYAEAFQYPDRPPGQHKGLRDDPEGQIIGDFDEYVTRAGEQEYEPYEFRVFRYIRIDIEVGEEPLVLLNCGYRETGYPLKVSSQFEASDPVFAELWQVSLNTLQRCMHETYEDCPYYEQLQYVLDTRLTSLFTYYVSGDDRLARQAIEAFHASLMPMGLIQSRAPSAVAQVIPSFALQWILMLHDHWQFFGDDTLIRRYRPTIDAILDWFDRERTSTGLVLTRGYWPFMDWVNGWSAGIPPTTMEQPGTTLNAMYAVTLATAAELMEVTGRTDVGGEYRQRSQAVVERLEAMTWDPETERFRDGVGSSGFSQHAQAWALLAGLPATGRKPLAMRMVQDSDLSQASYPGLFAVQQALAKEGLGEAFQSYWDRWKDMVACHLTTWEEDSVGRRSDCHAWGSLPLYVFAAHILGVRPGRPGFGEIIVAPEEHGLTWARGMVTTAKGPVSVAWQRRPDRATKIVTVQAPVGVPTRIHVGGQVHTNLGGAMQVEG
jgi:hypothetical protein